MATLLDKRNGLSEMNVSSTTFQEADNQLIIGYKSGAIDVVGVLPNGDLESNFTIDFIKKTPGARQQKQINKLFVMAQRLFAATDFGLVEIDLRQREVKETYRNIGPGGSLVKVSDISVQHDSIFLHTSAGVLGGSLAANVNLLFFGNWKLLPNSTVFRQTISIPPNAVTNKVNDVKRDKNGFLWIADGINGLVSDFSGKFESYSPDGLPETGGYFYRDTPDVGFAGKRNFVFRENTWQPTAGTIPVKNPLIKDAFGNSWQLVNNTVRVVANGRSTTISQFNGLSGQPTDLAADRENQFWVATTNGVTVIPSATDFPSNPTEPYTPVFGNQRLLLQQIVNAVAIDGGNRKWFGTNNGLFCFDADIEKLIHFFDVENSLLPDDQVLDLEINERGELFILTNSGVISYQTDASEPSETFDNVLVFPNPVKPGPDNLVSVKGLSEKTTVKIVSQDGRVVNTTTSNGGTASWNLLLPDGSEAPTGVYFVMAISRDLGEKLVGRFAVVR